MNVTTFIRHLQHQPYQHHHHYHPIIATTTLSTAIITSTTSSYGSVFKAVDLRDGQVVAVKILEVGRCCR